MKIEKAIAPSAWASYLINGDSSGLAEKDIRQADSWIARLGFGMPVDCTDAGFRHSHDAWIECPFSADCQEYAFLV